MPEFVVPRGRELRLSLGGTRIPDVSGRRIKMILEDEITITLSSKFQPLVGSSEKTVLNMISSLTSEFFDLTVPSEFKEMGFQIWGGTDPLSFSPTISFYMDTSAKEDVYEPTLQLMRLPLPDDRELIKGTGFTGLIPPGPSISTIFGVEGKNGKNISLEIDKVLRINRVIVKKAEPTFSSEVDEDGYPIYSKVRLDISSLYTATVQMIQTKYTTTNTKASQETPTVN